MNKNLSFVTTDCFNDYLIKTFSLQDHLTNQMAAVVQSIEAKPTSTILSIDFTYDKNHHPFVVVIWNRNNRMKTNRSGIEIYDIYRQRKQFLTFDKIGKIRGFKVCELVSYPSGLDHEVYSDVKNPELIMATEKKAVGKFFLEGVQHWQQSFNDELRNNKTSVALGTHDVKFNSRGDGYAHVVTSYSGGNTLYFIRCAYKLGKKGLVSKTIGEVSFNELVIDENVVNSLDCIVFSAPSQDYPSGQFVYYVKQNEMQKIYWKDLSVSCHDSLVVGAKQPVQSIGTAGDVKRFEISPDNQYLAVVYIDHSFSLLSIKDLSVLNTIPPLKDTITSLSFSACSQFVLVGDNTGHIQFYKVNPAPHSSPLFASQLTGLGQNVTHIKSSNDGRYILSHDDRKYSILDICRIANPEPEPKESIVFQTLMTYSDEDRMPDCPMLQVLFKHIHMITELNAVYCIAAYRLMTESGLEVDKLKTVIKEGLLQLKGSTLFLMDENALFINKLIDHAYEMGCLSNDDKRSLYIMVQRELIRTSPEMLKMQHDINYLNESVKTCQQHIQAVVNDINALKDTLKAQQRRRLVLGVIACACGVAGGAIHYLSGLVEYDSLSKVLSDILNSTDDTATKVIQSSIQYSSDHLYSAVDLVALVSKQHPNSILRRWFNNDQLSDPHIKKYQERLKWMTYPQVSDSLQPYASDMSYPSRGHHDITDKTSRKMFEVKQRYGQAVGDLRLLQSHPGSNLAQLKEAYIKQGQLSRKYSYYINGHSVEDISHKLILLNDALQSVTHAISCKLRGADYLEDNDDSDFYEIQDPEKLNNLREASLSISDMDGAKLSKAWKKRLKGGQIDKEIEILLERRRVLEIEIRLANNSLLKQKNHDKLTLKIMSLEDQISQVSLNQNNDDDTRGNKQELENLLDQAKRALMHNAEH